MLEALVKIKYYNDTISSFIGILANIFAIYIVRRRTSKEMRQYSQTLLQNCWVDLFFNIVICITKEQYDFMDGIYISMLNGFASKIPRPWDMVFHMAYLFGSVNWNSSLMVQKFTPSNDELNKTIYRGDMLSNYRIFTLYFFAIFICVIYACLFGLAHIPSQKTVEKTCALLKRSAFLNDNGQVPNFIASEVSNPLFVVSILLIVTTCFFGYILIFYFGKAIHRSLKEKKGKLSPTSFQFHQQINRVLMLQALTPIFVGNISTVLFITGIFIKASGFMMIDGMMISWVCVVNPFFAMLMVETYRKAVMHPKKYLFVPDLKNLSINK